MIKARAIWSYKEKRKFLKKTPPFKNYIKKTILPDAESREEYDATKYSPIG